MKKAKKGLWVLLLVIVLAVFAVSAYKVVSHLLDRGASRRFQEELIDQMVTMVSDTNVQDAQAAQPAPLQGAAVSSYAADESETGEGTLSQTSEMPLQQPSDQQQEQQTAQMRTPAEAAQEAKSAAEAEPAQQMSSTATEFQSPAEAPWTDISAANSEGSDPEITAQLLQTTAEPGINIPAAEVTPEPAEASSESTTAVSAVPTVTPAPTPSETAPIAVDFDKLTSKYQNVVCWVYLPKTPVNYAVAQGEDNVYYLHRLLGGGYSYSGSIFMDYMNTPDFSDWNTILYGHNMKNGSMFGYIPYYAVQQYYEQHPYLYLLTPDQDFKVELFAGYVTTPDSDAYLIAQTMEERDDIIAEALRMSTFEADVEIGPEDRIVTLSTCTYAFDNARYVLLGVLRPLAPQAE